MQEKQDCLIGLKHGYVKDDSLRIDDLKEKIDFTLAFAVVHEVPDASNFFSEVYKAMKPNRKVLVVEPKMHVSKEDFETTVSIAQNNGFKVTDEPHIALSNGVILEKFETQI